MGSQRIGHDWVSELSVGGRNELFLTKRIKQKWPYVSSMQRSWRHRASLSSALSCSGALGKPAARFWRDSGSPRRGTYEKKQATRKQVLQFPARLQMAAAWLTSCLQPRERLWARISRQAAPVSESQDLGDDKCFKPRGFGVICDAAIDKKYSK